LRKERRLELAGEGEYWFDLVRISYYNPTKAITILRGYEDSRNRIEIDGDTGEVTPGDSYGVITDPTLNSFQLPVPSTEITANPYLLEPAIPYSF
jgi:hypothetical protein